MGKVLKIAAVVVGVAALIVTGAGLVFGAAAVTAALGGVTAGMLAAASGVLSIGASLLATKPKPPSIGAASIDRLYVSLDPRTGRKSVFGTTALATDIRDQESAKTGHDEDIWVDRFIVHAAHKLTSIDEIWFDDDLVWTPANGTTGSGTSQKDGKNYLTVNTRLEGNAGNAINISPRMGTHRIYTGCGYTRLRFLVTPESPYASSIPSRVTFRGKGMPVYDPRKDSTVPGGSGTQRADNQTTWTFDSGGNLQGDNPALQLLTWLLGWKINGKLSVGRGIPKDRFNMESFITAANINDEAVAKKAGGTERRYRAAAIIDEREDPISVVDRFKNAMNATLDDVDGQIRIQVLVNDLGAPVGNLEEKDVINEFSWKPFQSLTEQVNVIRGQYVDPSNKSLYQLVDYADVTVTSADGIERPQMVSFDTVQSSSQAQRLAKTRLQRMQYPGMFQATFQVTGWKVQKGDVVTFTFGPTGFFQKLFRVAEIEYRADGLVPMTLKEENAAIYAWDSSDEADVNIADPTQANLLNTPWYQVITGAWVPPGWHSPDGNMLVDAQFGNLWTKTGVVRTLGALVLPAYPQDARMPYVAELALGSGTESSSANIELPWATVGRNYFGKVRIARSVGSTGNFDFYYEWDFFDASGTAIPGSSFQLHLTQADLPADGNYREFLAAIPAPAGAVSIRNVGIRVPTNAATGSIRVDLPWVSDVQPGANVATTLGYGPSSVVINYDSGGVIIPGQLPGDLIYKVYAAGVPLTNVTLSGVWRIVGPGGINGLDASSGAQALTVDDVLGTVTLTLNSVEADDTDISIEAVANGVPVQPFVVKVTRSQSAPSTGGGGSGGGGTATGGSFSFTGPFPTINSASYMDLSGLQTVIVGTGQTQVDLTAFVSYKHSSSSVAGDDTAISFKIQRETSPGSYVDVGAVVTVHAKTTADPETGHSFRKAGIANFTRNESLSPGTYKYRLVALRAAAPDVIWIGSTTNNFSGVPS